MLGNVPVFTDIGCVCLLAQEGWKTNQIRAQVLQEDSLRDGLVIFVFVHVRRNPIEISAWH